MSRVVREWRGVPQTVFPGQRFGNLVVDNVIGYVVHSGKKVDVHCCHCDCGCFTERSEHYLKWPRKGRVQACKECVEVARQRKREATYAIM